MSRRTAGLLLTGFCLGLGGGVLLGLLRVGPKPADAGPDVLRRDMQQVLEDT